MNIALLKAQKATIEALRPKGDEEKELGFYWMIALQELAAEAVADHGGTVDDAKEGFLRLVKVGAEACIKRLQARGLARG